MTKQLKSSVEYAAMKAYQGPKGQRGRSGMMPSGKWSRRRPDISNFRRLNGLSFGLNSSFLTSTTNKWQSTST